MAVFGRARTATDTGVIATLILILAFGNQAFTEWKTWQHLKNARAQDWYGYDGAWGEVGNYADTTGPQGPSRFKPPAPKG